MRMKILVKNIWRIIPILLLSVAMVSCSDDDETVSSFFKLSSTDLECNSSNVIDVVVPIAGQTYKLSVKSSVNVTWTTKFEGGSWLTATPVTKQNGDGEIVISASRNSTNMKNRIATVTIRNSANDEVYQYAFTQLYDPTQMTQKEEKYTYIYYKDEIKNNKDDQTFTTYVDKVSGAVSITPLGQEDLDKYNVDNKTKYEMLPGNCYTLPTTVTFGSEASAPLDIIFNKNAKSLNLNKEYMLPISVSVGDRRTEIIWVILGILEREVFRNDNIVFDFYKINEDIIFNAYQDIEASLPIDKKTSGKVTLVPFTEADLAAYNLSFSKSYVSIPEEYVVMPDGGFEESSKVTNIIFRKEMGRLDETQKWVLGLHVYIDDFLVSEVFMKPHIRIPTVILDSKEYRRVIILDEGEKKTSSDFKISLNVVKNLWDLKVEFEGDESKLQAKVDEYNRSKDTSYPLLPKANRTLSSPEFTQNEEEKFATATFLGKDLTLEKDYLYPIILTGCGKESPFVVEEKVVFVHVTLEKKVNSISELSEITLNTSRIKASGTDGGNVVGNLLAYNGFWESIWSPGSDRKSDPKIDPVYGVYIDIDFSQKPLLQVFSFNYLPRSYANAVPNEIVIYAGTSKDDLKKIGKLTYDDNKLPYADKTWIGRVNPEDKSKLSLYKLEESGVTIVRLSFFSSREMHNNSNTIKKILGYNWLQTTSGDYPSVALQQLKVYGE